MTIEMIDVFVAIGFYSFAMLLINIIMGLKIDKDRLEREKFH